jgi:hypothetical protein
VPYRGDGAQIVNDALNIKYSDPINIISPEETLRNLKNMEIMEFLDGIVHSELHQREDFPTEKYLLGMPENERNKIAKELNDCDLMVVPYCNWKKIEPTDFWLCRGCDLSIAVKIEVYDLKKGILIYSHRYGSTAKIVEEGKTVDYRYGKSVPYAEMINHLFDYLFEQMKWNLSLE